jgi:hypothetical protein
MKVTDEMKKKWPLWEISYVYPGAGTIVTYQVRERTEREAKDEALGLFTAKLETHSKRIKASAQTNEDAREK